MPRTSRKARKLTVLPPLKAWSWFVETFLHYCRHLFVALSVFGASQPPLLQSFLIVPCTQVAKPRAMGSLSQCFHPRGASLANPCPAEQIPSSSSPGWKVFWGPRIVSATRVLPFEGSTFDDLSTSPQRATSFWTGESMVLPRWIIWRQFCCCCVTLVQWQAVCDVLSTSDSFAVLFYFIMFPPLVLCFWHSDFSLRPLCVIMGTFD